MRGLQEIQQIGGNLQALRVAHSRFVSSKAVVSAINPDDEGACCLQGDHAAFGRSDVYCVWVLRVPVFRVCVRPCMHRTCCMRCLCASPRVWPGPGRDLLVPLTDSMFVPGSLASSTEVLIDIGTGYYLKKTIPGAVKVLDKKVWPGACALWACVWLCVFCVNVCCHCCACVCDMCPCVCVPAFAMFACV